MIVARTSLRICRVVFTWSLLVTVLSGCRTMRAADRPGDRADDHRQIMTLLQGSADAWNRGDLAGHLSIYDDSVTFMTDTGPRTGIKPIEVAFARKYFRDGRPKQTLGFDQLVVRYPAVDVALVTGRFSLTGGGEPDQRGRFSLLWQRKGTKWAVIHDHSS